VAPNLVDVQVAMPDSESDLPQARTQAGAERVTEPAAVRDYQSGDPRRLVHWKATARRDRLMVREVVLRGLPQVWVLVDDAAPAGQAAEAALSAAASVALRLLRAGHTVHLVPVAARPAGPAPEVRFDPAGGSGPLLEALARVRLAPEGFQAGGAGGLGFGRRLLGEIGARGAVAPIYGAFAQVTDQLAAELGPLAAIARPGQLWLTGPDAQDAALRRQGWTVTRIP
jgi:uncharacterized protein (DUF58 family)